MFFQCPIESEGIQGYSQDTGGLPRNRNAQYDCTAPKATLKHAIRMPWKTGLSFWMYARLSRLLRAALSINDIASYLFGHRQSDQTTLDTQLVLPPREGDIIHP